MGDEGTQVLEASGRQALGAGLDQDVADGSGFDGAGQNGKSRAVGGGLAEQLVLGATADDVDGADGLAGDYFTLKKHE